MADINNIKYSILLIMIAITTQIYAQESSSDPALNAYRQGDYDKAIELYSELLAKNSDDKNLKFNLGGAFYQKGTLNSAKSGFEDALTLEAPEAKSRAYYNLGNTLFRMNKAEKSLEAFKYAMKFNPEDEDAKFNYEFVKSMLERFEALLRLLHSEEGVPQVVICPRLRFRRLQREGVFKPRLSRIKSSFLVERSA